jgi:pyridoxal 5'-phosphate synthase pdxS subunit
MALERVPSDIRRDGGVARMSDPAMIEKIMKTVSIPVMAKCRIGHFAEAQVLRSLGVDCIDEARCYAGRRAFRRQVRVHRPVRVQVRNLGEALRRIGEGAAMIHTKARREPGTSSRRCVTCEPWCRGSSAWRSSVRRR